MSALLVCPFLSCRLSLAQSSTNHALSAPPAKLTLRVYNYARTDAASLISSEKVADVILEKAGIEPVWVNCPLSQKEAHAYPSCDSEMGTGDLVLRILPRHMAAKLHLTDDPLGFAQTCSETEPACELNVLYNQIEELGTHGYRADRIMGHAIAHEIAHVLIGPAHSEEGIMRGEWTSAELQRISWGLSLDFTRNQSTRLRNAALRRTTPAPKGLLQANLMAR
jgi:hypothetical protein